MNAAVPEVAADAIDEIPPATPATPDLVCWIWAAVPPRDGRIHISRAAHAFGVSDTTMRRWIANADELELNHPGIVRATQLAILRSKGHILWPDLDPGSLARAEAALRYAARAEHTIANPRRIPAAWKTNGTTEPHQVLLVHWPRAHAYTITVTRTRKTITKITSAGGEIIQTADVGHLYAGDLIKYRTLANHADQRCITPRSLIPIGRTDAIREQPKPPSLDQEAG